MFQTLHRSAVELVKIVRETLEALFDLHLGIPEEVVTVAGQGLDSFLQRWRQYPSPRSQSKPPQAFENQSWALEQIQFLCSENGTVFVCFRMAKAVGERGKNQSADLLAELMQPSHLKEYFDSYRKI